MFFILIRGFIRTHSCILCSVCYLCLYVHICVCASITTYVYRYTNDKLYIQVPYVFTNYDGFKTVVAITIAVMVRKCKNGLACTQK